METLTFGKYKTRPVERIIETDPGYIKWALKNVSFFELTKEQEELLDKQVTITTSEPWPINQDDYEDRVGLYSCSKMGIEHDQMMESLIPMWF